jgi:hypothetical protein
MKILISYCLKYSAQLWPKNSAGSHKNSLRKSKKSPHLYLKNALLDLLIHHFSPDKLKSYHFCWFISQISPQFLPKNWNNIQKKSH